MSETDYNARLYEKMKAEQDNYRDWLLHQELPEILNHTYECHKAKQRTLFDKLEFVKSTYFKKEPSLMRKLLFCTPYFFNFKPSRNASPTRSVTL